MTRGLLLVACSALVLGACERGMHQMYEQPKYKPLTPTPLFPDGNSSRPQVTGTIPHSSGILAGSSSGRSGEIARTPVRDINSLAITPALLARGRDRFDVFCAPCHSRAGDGDGMVVRRGFPAPPSFHTDRLRNAADSHFYQVITDGYGVMYPYRDRIAPRDRWSIVAYVRALQLSQHAPASLLSKEDLARLQQDSPVSK